MESKRTTAVKLLKNNIYPTYQLYAQMASKTDPKKGLVLAALITVDWLKNRIGEDLPPELGHIPAATEYDSFDPKELKSVYINEGYVVNIVSLPDSGMWTLRITEPDLGSNPGDLQQRRSAVAGRIIESNISFKITDQRLECGFQTLISDPEGTTPQAEVYRFAIIRKLAAHPDFGLKHIIELKGDLQNIRNKKRAEELKELWKNAENQLPIVVFTDPSDQKAASMELLGSVTHNISLRLNRADALLKDMVTQQSSAAPSGDPANHNELKNFAKSMLGFAHVFYLAGDVIADFSVKIGKKIAAGDVVILEPMVFGRKVTVENYANGNLDTRLEKLKSRLQQYPLNKEIRFGDVMFLSYAREELIRSTEQLKSSLSSNQDKASQQLAENESKWRALLAKKDDELEKLRKNYGIEKDKEIKAELKIEDVKASYEGKMKVLDKESARKDSIIAYYKRKVNIPKSHTEIPKWAEKYFSDKLFFHEKAKDLLQKTSPEKANIELICDALDYLATDYWNMVFGYETEDEVKRSCSEKYNRPFEVLSLGDRTIETFPNEYKVKYYKRPNGKYYESGLDKHLRIGNKSENLLRIYFFLDKEKQLLVIGSLPEHLSTLTMG